MEETLFKIYDIEKQVYNFLQELVWLKLIWDSICNLVLAVINYCSNMHANNEWKQQQSKK